jgi:hypothetical protein
MKEPKGIKTTLERTSIIIYKKSAVEVAKKHVRRMFGDYFCDSCNHAIMGQCVLGTNAGKQQS